MRAVFDKTGLETLAEAAIGLRDLHSISCLCEGWLGLLCCSLRRPRFSNFSI